MLRSRNAADLLYGMFRSRLAVALAALAAGLALLLLPLSWPRNPIAHAIEDAGHFPLSALLVGSCLWVLAATRLRLPLRLLLSLGLAILFAIGSEWLQGFTGRDPAWSDVRHDIFGAIAVIALYVLWRQRRASTQCNGTARVLTATIAALAALIALLSWLIPLSRALLAWKEREQRYPVLYAADFSRTDFLLRPAGSTLRPLQPVPVARRMVLPVRCGRAQYSGVVIDGPPPDWTRWQALRIDVINPGAMPFDLGITVRELRRIVEYDERFNLHLSLAPGELRSIVLPLETVKHGPRGRPLDMERIGGIAVFCAGEQREFQLLRIALE